MIEITRSDEELAEDALIDTVQQLRRRVDELQDYTRAVVEASHRPNLPSGPLFWRAQVTTAITPRSGSTVGTGAVVLCVLIGTTLYRKYPHKIVPVVNDAVSDTSIVANTEVWITMIDGQWSVIWQDCGDSSPTAYADQPHP